MQHGPVAEPEDEDLRAPKRRWAVRMKEVLAAQQLQVELPRRVFTQIFRK
ncbi:uncharacterized protein PHALS_12974 [Plasmopara halstedii]|uniref:Uncharacterized protein n=1 Tax=Plasmopara halstedii TaxID=4781 RepID=A0A0P1AMX9_PLAHL|nr:uncharacterized protein PHALS_12974 [Plasmopara halstedii]CEG42722.1 hypothetical protein PHALS_12974 [Plasmopara halstedii]|eukprot:XP_024579091.1 hypothetical protein PHALS_12974 [Plasmopara halstedii]